MSTLSIPTPRATSEPDMDARFSALVRSAVPAQREPATRGFEAAFDLGYGHDRLAAASAVPEPRAARRVRAAAVQRRPAPVAVDTRPARLTRRGRTVVVLFFVGLALALMIPMSGWATASLSGGAPEPVRVIQVGPGDTLYGIAGDLAEPGEIREMVHRIQELNSLPGAQISEGQKLAVPRG